MSWPDAYLRRGRSAGWLSAPPGSYGRSGSSICCSVWDRTGCRSPNSAPRRTASTSARCSRAASQTASRLLMGRLTRRQRSSCRKRAPRLLAEADRRTNGHLALIGRRQLRSNNSWLHNSPRLMKGDRGCTLLVHPADAAARQLATGDLAELESEAGRLAVPVEVTDAVRPGVVSLPHGWGHDRAGARLGVARNHAGASANDVTSERYLDTLSGNAAFNDVPVTVRRHLEMSSGTPAAGSPRALSAEPVRKRDLQQ